MPREILMALLLRFITMIGACVILCSELCCSATLILHACGIELNEECLRQLASRCDRFTKACGYIRKLYYIRFTNITVPILWRWHCIDIKK